jgi:Fe-S-cluster containining protein
MIRFTDRAWEEEVTEKVVADILSKAKPELIRELKSRGITLDADHIKQCIAKIPPITDVDVAAMIASNYVGVCNRCGECCRQIPIVEIEQDDVSRMASYLGMDAVEFSIKYVNADGERFYLKNSPCSFLTKANKCSIYPARPQSCRSFPFTRSAERTRTIEIPKYCAIGSNFLSIKVMSGILFLILPKDMRDAYQSTGAELMRRINKFGGGIEGAFLAIKSMKLLKDKARGRS